MMNLLEQYWRPSVRYTSSSSKTNTKTKTKPDTRKENTNKSSSSQDNKNPITLNKINPTTTLATASLYNFDLNLLSRSDKVNAEQASRTRDQNKNRAQLDGRINVNGNTGNKNKSRKIEKDKHLVKLPLEEDSHSHEPQLSIPWLNTGPRLYFGSTNSDNSINDTDSICSDCTIIDMPLSSIKEDEVSNAKTESEVYQRPVFRRELSVSERNLTKIRREISGEGESHGAPNAQVSAGTDSETAESSANTDQKNAIIFTISSITLLLFAGSFLSRLLIIALGFIYPAYNSFKAIKSANVRNYVRWMMYWVVFAIFVSCEYFTDIFISWLPFYYEGKVLVVIWLSSDYCKGASVVYRRVLHPLLLQKEKIIDLWIEKNKDESINYLVETGKKGMQVAAKGFQSGGENLAAKAVASGILESINSAVKQSALEGSKKKVSEE